MDLLDKTKEICKLHNIYPSRSKGQNFLINEAVYDKIITAASLTKEDFVIEVGPGLGFLTAKLAAVAGRVLAVELDDNLAELNREKIKKEELKNIGLINSDILKLNLFDASYKVPVANYKIVANLPYNITSFFLRTVFTSWPKPKEVVLLLQKEVVNRICAKPGDMSLLALSIQYYAEVEKLFDVSKKDFWPSPEIDSAVVRMKVKNDFFSSSKEGLNREALQKRFFQLAKIGFSAKRKMLKNNLAAGLHISHGEAEEMLKKAGLKDKVRAEDLSLDNWIFLAGNY